MKFDLSGKHVKELASQVAYWQCQRANLNLHPSLGLHEIKPIKNYRLKKTAQLLAGYVPEKSRIKN